MANNFRAGAYSITIDGSDCGQTLAGFSFGPSMGFDYARTDKFGDAIVDAVVRGGNYRLEFQAAEWNATGRAKMTNFLETTIGTMNNIGKLVVIDGLAKQIVLTPIVAASGAKTLTMPLCIPEPDSGRYNLNNRLYTIINRWLILADSSGKCYAET